MINLLYSGNGKVFDGVLTSLLSIVKRTETKEPFKVFVFTMDITRIKPEYTAISEEDTGFLDKVLKEYNPESEVVRVDVGDIYERELAYCPNEKAYCSPYTLLRLLADEVEGMPDKLLYLDADIMFNRDITLLYGKDIENYEYAAARDHYGKFLLRPDYINAGVLLFNMKKCAETGLFGKARALMRKKKYMFADQDAVFRSTTKKMLLPQRYNDQKFLHKHTVVRHFSKRLFWFPYPHTDNIKQWHTEKVRKVFGYKCFDDVLDEYERLKKKKTEGEKNYE
ncbi:MAG TPA: lipopolysaccharide biosynthesis protein [Clostridiales bacterium]|nr:lipopolysaccharide biosynthesis protein [Clostridiales bacterium]